MSNSVHLSDMSRVPDQRCFRPFRNRQSAARSVLPNWQLPLTGRLVKYPSLAAPAWERLVKYETRLCTEYQSVLSGRL